MSTVDQRVPGPMNHAPAPGAAPVAAMVAAQARFELKLMLGNGEQILLTLIIPVALLLGLTAVNWIDLGSGPRIDVVTPGILALAVMSTAFTAQAISTGFDRRYGVLKLLGATPLPRTGLVAAKTVAIIALEVVQVAVISGIAFILGWSPHGDLAAAAVLLLAGTAAFSALAIALAGVLRAEATLAVANGIYLLLLLVGGTVIPQDRMPSWLATVSDLLPSGALGGGLRDVLLDGSGMPWAALGVLITWTAAAVLIAARTFKWE